jgi:hypothetical protein
VPNPNDGIIAASALSLNTQETTPQNVLGPVSFASVLTASAGVSTQAPPTSYLGFSVPPEVNSPTAVVLTTAYGYLTRVYVPVTGVSTYLDVILTANGSPSNAIWGLYTGSGVNPVAYTAESHASITGNGLFSVPWVTTVTLTPGYYYVYQCYTATTPSMPGVTASSTGSVGATIMNPNCSLSATVPTLNAAVLTSGAPTTISGTTQLTWGTSWALSASKLWYGIR